MSSYGFGITVRGSMDAIVGKVTAALKAEGFGVLTEINVKDTLKAKINVDTRPCMILGACNPQLAHRALAAEPDIGLLLPCNVVVREEADGSINVGFMDPIAVLKLTDNPSIVAVAREVRGKLERVRDALK
jgi:uncharacterized protein (DUF302 family)